MNIKFLRGTFAQYQAATKNAETLYFITDTGALYLGEKLIGKDYETVISALQNAGYQNAAQVDELISAALAGYYTKGEIDNLLAGLEVGSLDSRIETIEKDYLKAADKTELEGKINNKVEKVEGYSLVSDTEIARLANVDNYDDAEVRGFIDAVEEDIAEINNTENGILAQAKAYTDEMKDSILGEGIKDTFDTLVEIQTWMEGEGVNATELSEAIAAEAKSRDDADKAINAKLEGLGEQTVKGYVDAEIAKVDAAGINEKITTIEDNVTSLQNGKVDKIEGYSLVSDTEIARLAEVDNYDDTALAGRVKAIEDLGLAENYALKSEVKAVDDKLANYVEKEGYIAYTQEEKDKLAGLNNYNDTEVRGLISGVDGRLATVEGKVDVAKVSEAIASALQEAKDYADTNDADTKYDDTAVRGLITALDGEVDGIAERVGVIEAKPAMGITADDITNWNGKTTLAAVKEAYIGNTEVKLEAVVAAVNRLYDGSEGVNNEIKAMDQNVKALEGALTWGEIK